jgi:hypothetical protein
MELVFGGGGASTPRQLALTLADSDYYGISADRNAMLRLETATPGGGTGAFGNHFDPVLRLYDSAGHLVASDDNSAPDGRNAVLSYKVPKNGGGAYYVQVTSSAAAGHLTTGEYLLSIQGQRMDGKEFKLGEDKDDEGRKVGKTKENKQDSSGARTGLSADFTGLADHGALLLPTYQIATTLGHEQEHAHANRNAPAAASTARGATSQLDAGSAHRGEQDSLDEFVAALGRKHRDHPNWEDGREDSRLD